MARRKKSTPVVKYGSVIPKVFGTAGDAIEQYVTFGIGNINKIVSGSDASTGLIAFGYNSDLKSGAIAIGGELVSSKILDVSLNNSNVKTPEVTVKYLDASIIKDITFNTIDPSIIEILDSSLSNLYQEVIDNEEVIIHFLDLLNTSINLNIEAISNMGESLSLTDNSINIIENNYVKSIQTINSSALVINDITPANTKGKQYEIGVIVDDNTIKIENGKLTSYGNTYTIKATNIPTEGYLKTYQLYQTNAAGVETEVSNAKIDIPKDFVLKEAHLCKATVTEQDGNLVYTEIARASDPNFDQASGEIYLHFIWQTKDVSTMTSETYIKVSDMAPIYTGDADTDPSTGKYISINSNHVVTFDSSKLYNNLIEPLDTSLKALQIALEDDELIITNTFLLLNTSIINNTLDISILKRSIANTNSSLNTIIQNVSILNSSVSEIETTYVQDVSANVVNSSLILVKSYTPDYENATTVPSIIVEDSSISYRITKTINGEDTDVIDIKSVNPNLIDELSDILTDHAQRLDETEYKWKWITI